MKPLTESVLHTGIQSAIDDVAAAKRILADVILNVQSTCEHRIVSETPYRSGGFAAMRICNHCLMEEEGSHWSGGTTWSKYDYGKSDLGNVEGRIVLPVDIGTFYSMRVRS